MRSAQCLQRSGLRRVAGLDHQQHHTAVVGLAQARDASATESICDRCYMVPDARPQPCNSTRGCESSAAPQAKEGLIAGRFRHSCPKTALC